MEGVVSDGDGEGVSGNEGNGMRSDVDDVVGDDDDMEGVVSDGDGEGVSDNEGNGMKSDDACTEDGSGADAEVIIDNVGAVDGLAPSSDDDSIIMINVSDGVFDGVIDSASEDADDTCGDGISSADSDVSDGVGSLVGSNVGSCSELDVSPEATVTIESKKSTFS